MNADSIREMTVRTTGDNLQYFRAGARTEREKGHADSAKAWDLRAQTNLETLVNMRRALLSAAHELSATFTAVVPSAEARAKVDYFLARIDQVDDCIGGGL